MFFYHLHRKYKKKGIYPLLLNRLIGLEKVKREITLALVKKMQKRTLNGAEVNPDCLSFFCTQDRPQFLRFNLKRLVRANRILCTEWFS